MTRLNVNPTRMELNKLKTRLKTATRGHKLLKDKTDEMIRRFSVIIRENKRLRDEIESEIANIFSSFALARSVMTKPEIELAFSVPSVTIDLDCDFKNIMSVNVPDVQMQEIQSESKYPYSLAAVTSEADYSVRLVGEISDKLIKLAAVEKTSIMLANEIEKSKRRVKALEYILIPNIEETIKYITMKLEENERGSRTRLMKVKTMLENKQ